MCSHLPKSASEENALGQGYPTSKWLRAESPAGCTHGPQQSKPWVSQAAQTSCCCTICPHRSSPPPHCCTMHPGPPPSSALCSPRLTLTYAMLSCITCQAGAGSKGWMRGSLDTQAMVASAVIGGAAAAAGQEPGGPHCNPSRALWPKGHQLDNPALGNAPSGLVVTVLCWEAGNRFKSHLDKRDVELYLFFPFPSP